MPKPSQGFDLSTFGLLISVIVSTIIIVAFLQVLLRTNSAIVGSRGHIITSSGIFVDKSSIDWGTLYPDSNGTEVINIKNVGAYRQTLALSTSAWVPSNASAFMTLSWNYSGAALQPSKQIPVELRLYVHLDVRGIANFSFNINIIGA